MVVAVMARARSREGEKMSRPYKPFFLVKSGQVVFAKTRCELKSGVAVTLDKGSNAVIESLSRFYVVI